MQLSNLIKTGICKSHKVLRFRADYKPFYSFLTPQDILFKWVCLAFSMKNAVQYLPTEFCFVLFFLDTFSIYFQDLPEISHFTNTHHLVL